MRTALSMCLGAAALIFGGGCGGDTASAPSECTAGSADCSCRADGGCDEGLSCSEGRCAPEAGGGTDSAAFEGSGEVHMEFDHPREEYFPVQSSDYAHHEGTLADNHCVRDEDCLISGCSRSTCAAEAVEVEDSEFCLSRELSSWPSPQLGSCGCIEEECRWYFENDYDRACSSDDDCSGLGPPPDQTVSKGRWLCVEAQCRWGEA